MKTFDFKIITAENGFILTIGHYAGGSHVINHVFKTMKELAAWIEKNADKELK